MKIRSNHTHKTVKKYTNNNKDKQAKQQKQ